MESRRKKVIRTEVDVWSHGESNTDEDTEVDVWNHGESNEMRILRWMCGVESDGEILRWMCGVGY